MELHERLRQYNRWRSGEEDWAPDERGPDPKELGELIATVADRLEVLEREHAEFFDRWHDERRKREALECAAKNLVAVKGRHHTAQAFKKLCDAVEKVGAGWTVQNAKAVGLDAAGGQSHTSDGLGTAVPPAPTFEGDNSGT